MDWLIVGGPWVLGKYPAYTVGRMRAHNLTKSENRFHQKTLSSSTMSFIIRRQLSTLIPPKIASAKVCNESFVHAKKRWISDHFSWSYPSLKCLHVHPPQFPWKSFISDQIDSEYYLNVKELIPPSIERFQRWKPSILPKVNDPQTVHKQSTQNNPISIYSSRKSSKQVQTLY